MYFFTSLMHSVIVEIHI